MLGSSQSLLFVQRDRQLLLILFCAATLGVVFSVALAGKLSRAGFSEFRESITQLWPGRSPLSRSACYAVASTVVVAEGFVVATLASSTMVTIASEPVSALASSGFAVATALLVVFAAVHLVALQRKRTVRCACFGRTNTTVGPISLVRSAVLIVVAVVGFGSTAGRGLSALTAGELSGWSAIPAVVVGGVCGILLVHLDDLVDLFKLTSTPTRQGG
ncbi:MAG: MauE/DoxX family redox-associated membrane protein [Angustibacter sp.]